MLVSPKQIFGGEGWQSGPKLDFCASPRKSLGDRIDSDIDESSPNVTKIEDIKVRIDISPFDKENNSPREIPLTPVPPARKLDKAITELDDLIKFSKAIRFEQVEEEEKTNMRARTHRK